MKSSFILSLLATSFSFVASNQEKSSPDIFCRPDGLDHEKLLSPPVCSCRHHENLEQVRPKAIEPFRPIASR